jgi:hypothetical protein
MTGSAILKRLMASAVHRPDDRELADLGLSRADYALLVQSPPGARARIEHIAARLGVTPSMIDAEPGMAQEIAETCAACSEARACQRGIDTGAGFATVRCPNANRFRDLAGA